MAPAFKAYGADEVVFIPERPGLAASKGLGRRVANYIKPPHLNRPGAKPGQPLRSRSRPLDKTIYAIYSAPARRPSGGEARISPKSKQRPVCSPLAFPGLKNHCASLPPQSPLGSRRAALSRPPRRAGRPTQVAVAAPNSPKPAQGDRRRFHQANRGTTPVSEASVLGAASTTQDGPTAPPFEIFPSGRCRASPGAAGGRDGLGVPGSRFTYGFGGLVLIRANPGFGRGWRQGGFESARSLREEIAMSDSPSPGLRASPRGRRWEESSGVFPAAGAQRSSRAPPIPQNLSIVGSLTGAAKLGFVRAETRSSKGQQRADFAAGAGWPAKGQKRARSISRRFPC